MFNNPSYSSLPVGLHVTYTFNRVLYQPVNIAGSCQAGGSDLFAPSSCSLNIPYQSSYTALIVVDSTPYPDDETEDISIATSLGARVWVYVLIGVVPTLFLFGILLACVLVKKYRQKVLNNPSTNVGSGNEVSARRARPYD